MMQTLKAAQAEARVCQRCGYNIIYSYFKRCPRCLTDLVCTVSLCGGCARGCAVPVGCSDADRIQTAQSLSDRSESEGTARS